MPDEVDIMENDILNDLGQEVLETLLIDRSVTAYKNDGQVHHIFWATDDYKELGDGYKYFDEVQVTAISGNRSNVIMPRVLKRKALKAKRVKSMVRDYRAINQSWFRFSALSREPSPSALEVQSDRKGLATIHELEEQ